MYKIDVLDRRLEKCQAHFNPLLLWILEASYFMESRPRLRENDLWNGSCGLSRNSKSRRRAKDECPLGFYCPAMNSLDMRRGDLNFLGYTNRGEALFISLMWRL